MVDAHDPYGLTDSLTLTLSVTNLDETGGVTFDKRRPIRNQPLTATLEDPDGVQGAESWTWHCSTSRGGGWGEPITGAGSNVFTPVAADCDHYLRATVEYSDAERVPLSYSLQGSSDFVIDSRTGQIKVAAGVVLDFDSGQTRRIIPKFQL